MHMNKRNTYNAGQILKRIGYTSLLLMALNLQTGCSSEPLSKEEARKIELAKTDDGIEDIKAKIEKEEKRHAKKIKELNNKLKDLEKTKRSRQ